MVEPLNFNPIDEIHPFLFISGMGALFDRKLLTKYNIQAVLNVMEAKHYDLEEYISFLHCPINDGELIPAEQLKIIFAFIHKQITLHKRLLVHCAMGMSRSAGIVIGRLLIEHPNWSWDDALVFCRKIRNVLPHWKIKQSILDYLEAIEGKRRFATDIDDLNCLAELDKQPAPKI